MHWHIIWTQHWQCNGSTGRWLQNRKIIPLLRVKAGLLKKAGDSVASEKILKDAMPFANDDELNAYGYQLLGEKKYSEAIDAIEIKYAETSGKSKYMGQPG